VGDGFEDGSGIGRGGGVFGSAFISDLGLIGFTSGDFTSSVFAGAATTSLVKLFGPGRFASCLGRDFLLSGARGDQVPQRSTPVNEAIATARAIVVARIVADGRDA
jgi:hypothetical protein